MDSVLFSAMPYAYVFQSAGRNPSYGGDTIELNCSSYSASLPASEQPKMYYFWYIRSYGLLRNISSGPAVLQNGDVVPGYSIKNDGKTFVIESAQYADSYYCSVQEEGSPYKNLYNNYFFVSVYSEYNVFCPTSTLGKITKNSSNLINTENSIYF